MRMMTSEAFLGSFSSSSTSRVATVSSAWRSWAAPPSRSADGMCRGRATFSTVEGSLKPCMLADGKEGSVQAPLSRSAIYPAALRARRRWLGRPMRAGPGYRIAAFCEFEGVSGRVSTRQARSYFASNAPGAMAPSNPRSTSFGVPSKSGALGEVAEREATGTPAVAGRVFLGGDCSATQ